MTTTEQFQSDFDILEKFLHIDEGNLRGEWLRQPVLFITACREAARYESIAAQAALQLESLQAQLSCKYRADGIPTFSKVTDAGIDAAIDADPQVIQLKEAYSNAVTYKNLIQKFVRAIEIKGFSLKYVQMGSDFTAEDVVNTGRKDRARQMEFELRDIVECRD